MAVVSGSSVIDGSTGAGSGGISLAGRGVRGSVAVVGFVRTVRRLGRRLGRGKARRDESKGKMRGKQGGARSSKGKGNNEEQRRGEHP